MSDAERYAKEFRSAADMQIFGLQPGRTYSSDEMERIRTVAASLHAIADVFERIAG